jgi:hypothetical protein
MSTKNKNTSVNVSLPASQRKFVESEVAERLRVGERVLPGTHPGAPEASTHAAAATRDADRQRALEAVRTILELQQKLALKG